jgi:hypothetical protein
VEEAVSTAEEYNVGDKTRVNMHADKIVDAVIKAIIELLSFTTFFTWFESAAMPRFVFGVDCAEPLPANAAMASGGSATRLAYGG